MSIYQQSLQAYLAIDGNTQSRLADAAGVTQAAISRYASGERFPDRDTAIKIDAATASTVSVSIWRDEAARRLGIAA